MQNFKYQRMESPSQIKELMRWHNENSKHIVIDIETTGLNHFTDSIIAVVVTGREPNSAVYFDAAHKSLLTELKGPRLVLHNFKFDVRFLLRDGVDLRGNEIIDTMLLHHLLEENESHALDSIITTRYNDNYKEIFWGLYPDFQSAPLDAQIQYACKDVVYTGLLYESLLQNLQLAGVPTSLISHVHLLGRALLETEIAGLGVDLDYLTTLAVELKPMILKHQLEMRAMVDGPCTVVELDMWTKQIDKLYRPKGSAWQKLPRPEFNFSSSKQLSALLYDQLQLPAGEKRSVDDAALSGLEGQHPIITKLREYSEYRKIYTSFVEGTLKRVNNGRIYPSFNINGTVTGRISSSDPNLQQLPSSGAWSRVRGIYVPPVDSALINCDYSQLEVVIAAHFSQDPNLLKIVFEGASKHDITAESLGIERTLAKTLNFAMQYQCTDRKVAQILKCSPKEAKHIWNKYWETYAFEKRVIDECKAKVDSGRPIINPFGRQRHFSGPYQQQWERESAYRQAYSSLIQGTGADCTHYAFYTCARQLGGMGKALFEVHDEIVISAKLEYCVQASEVLKSCMINAGKVANLSVPLTVQCSGPKERWSK